MSALPQALPLALSAAVYPPALVILVLLLASDMPRRLALAYYAGAALLTLGVGLAGLAVLKGAGATSDSSRSASAWVDVALGVVLLAASVLAWRRRGHTGEPKPDESPGRVAAWSRRATSSPRWALLLGLVMFLPSPLYLLAIKEIADSGGSTASHVGAVLICAALVMVFVEIPVIGLFVRPDGVIKGIRAFQDWTTRHGWTIASAAAGVAGVYAVVKGVNRM